MPPLVPLRSNREFRAYVAARLTNSLATSALAVVVAYQTYQISHDPLALGWLGLVEATPALSLALFGGHVADRRDRRSLVLLASFAMVVCALLLAAISTSAASYGVLAIFGVIFLTGVAGGFERPALSAFEAQIIPIEQAAVGTSSASTLSQAGSIIGPAAGGIAYALIGPAATYLLIAALLVITTVCLALIPRKAMPVQETSEGTWHSVTLGLRYVLRSRILVGAMSLDLFAVLFGGAVAMLPIFASDILKVGPAGLGLLRIAPSAGALLVMVIATRRPPSAHAGSTLLACVFGFGVSILVFALSTNLLLSLAALFMSGVTDGISMIIRSVIVRLASPEHLRGRIASVNWLFVGASNEIGAFESGVAARLLGVVPSVAIGGVVTLAVVVLVALSTPELRHLDLRRSLVTPESA
jgi:MFS family permease